MSAHDDPDRDAWLRAALRHAPDAQAEPPSALSASILRQARAATRPVSASPVEPAPNTLARFWRWLARPPVAAGFASVTVATLVGVMWLDRPLDETLSPRRVPATSSAPRPAAPASIAAPPATAPATPEAAAPFATAEAASDEQRANRVGTKPAPQARRAAKEATPRPLPSTASPGVTATAPATTPFQDNATPAAPPAVARLPAASSPPTTPLTPAPFAAEGTSPASVGALSGRLRELSADAAQRSLSRALPAAATPPPSSGAAPVADQPQPAPPPPPASAIAGAASALAAPGALADRPGGLAVAIASITADPARWTYRRGGATRPMTPALQAWLARLEAAAAGRWHAGGSAATGAPTLRLDRDGAPVLVLRLSDGAATVGPQLRAELAPERIAELLADLDTAAP